MNQRIPTLMWTFWGWRLSTSWCFSFHQLSHSTSLATFTVSACSTFVWTMIPCREHWGALPKMVFTLYVATEFWKCSHSSHCKHGPKKRPCTSENRQNIAMRCMTYRSLNFCYCCQLMDCIFLAVSALLWVAAFILVVLFIYSVLAFGFLHQSFFIAASEDEPLFCETLAQCFGTVVRFQLLDELGTVSGLYKRLTTTMLKISTHFLW